MMPGLQELIHKFEEGEGRGVIKIFLVGLAFLALLVVYNLREFQNFRNVEAMDAAQVARNVAEGNGFSTQFVRPISFYLVDQRRIESGEGDGTSVLNQPHPDLANPPVYPLVLAGLMKVLPFDFEIPGRGWNQRYQPEVLIALFNQALFVVTVFLTFFLGRRLFDPAVAWLAAVLMAGTLLFWEFSVSGLSTMLLLVIFMGLIWCLVLIEQNAREEGRGLRWFLIVSALAGLLLGIGALTRYAFAWLLIPVLLFLLLFSGRWRVASAATVLLVFFVVFTPWLYRNYDASGAWFGISGYALYEGTSQFPENRLERLMSKDFEAALSQVSLQDFVRKFLRNTRELFQRDLLNLAGNWVTAFFLVGLLVPFLNPALSRLRYFLLGTLLTLIVVQALGRTHLSAASPVLSTENYLILLAPMIFLFGAALFFLLLDQIEFELPQMRRIVTVGFVVAMSAPLLFALMPPRSGPLAFPPYHPSLIQEMSGWMGENELMMSDVPWAVAWYGNRRCMWVTLDAPARRTNPPTRNDFFAVNDYQKRIQGIYLTHKTVDRRLVSDMVMGLDWAWGRFVLDSVVRTNVPPGFELKYAPTGLPAAQLFLTDHERWRLRQK